MTYNYKFNLFSTCWLLLFCLTFQSSFGQKRGAKHQEIILKFKESASIKKSACGQDLSLCLQGITAVKASQSIIDITEVSSVLTKNTFIARFNSTINVDQLIKNYTASGLFDYVERNHIDQPLANYPVPTYPAEQSFQEQWAFKNEGTMTHVYSTKNADIDMEYAWSIEKGNAGITVAILDTGVDYTHPDLKTRVWSNGAEIADNGIDDDNNGYIDDVIGYDFAESDNDPQDIHGHGTHIAGIIGADAQNGTGFVGTDWNCKLMLLKVVRDNMTSSYSDYADAIVYAADHGAKVINLSLTSYYYSTILEQAFAYANAKGVIIVVAMGNNGDSTTHFMAKSQYSIAVGATTPADKRASFSNYKDYIDVVAPGSYIYGLQHSDHNSQSFKMNGTSQATAFVSGLASLLIAQDPSRSPEDIRQIIRLTAEDQKGPASEDTPGFDYYFGHGRINAYAALSYQPGIAEVVFNGEEGYGSAPEETSETNETVIGQEEETCVTALYSQFESGFGAWHAGGIDALTSSNKGKSNSGSVKLIDNSGMASSIYTSTFNAADKTVIDLKFGFYPLSMESGEDFMFEVSTDGGSTYTTLKTWVSGTDFSNRQYVDESVILSDLSLSNQTVFRFRCDASSNSDYIFLDDIVINLCQNEGAVSCAGTPCDDGNACTVNDVYTADCNCVGTYEDKDNDGFCVGEDIDDLDSCQPDNSGCEQGAEEPLTDCDLISSSSFEKESDLWVLGGEDVSLQEGFGISGLNAIKLRDNSGIESSIFTKPLDFSLVNQVSVEFSYYGVSMETGESFVFELSMDNGRSFIEFKHWISGVDFMNRKVISEKIIVPKAYLTDQTIFRIRAIGSSNSDAVYVDDIQISACGEYTAPQNGVASVELSVEQLPLVPEATMTVYPNPAVDYIHLNTQNISVSDYDVHIYTLAGAQVYHSQFSVDDEVRIDVSAFNGGTQYILSVVTPQSPSPLFSTTFFKN